MDFRINNYELGERPGVTIPSPIFLAHLKEEGIRDMVSKHYDLLSKSSIKHLFPPEAEDLEVAKQHSADFFIQICGGPTYFNQSRGKPMLAARHAAFKITPDARLVWLKCYKDVLISLNLPDEVAQTFWNYINVFSNWMVNTPNR